jgi:hypothetical protein
MIPNLCHLLASRNKKIILHTKNKKPRGSAFVRFGGIFSRGSHFVLSGLKLITDQPCPCRVAALRKEFETWPAIKTARL